MTTITEQKKDTISIPVLKDVFNITTVESVKQDKFLSKEHPLAGHMNITPQWSTPVGEMELNLPEEMRIGLIKFIASRGYCTTMGTHKKTQTPEFEANHYNMFEFGEDEEVGQHIRGFEKIASEMIRYYIANSWGTKNVESMKLEARAFGNMQTNGRRTYPHYHHSFDGVMITYLTLGGEFDIKGEDTMNEELLIIPRNAEIEPIKNNKVADYGSFELSKDDLPCEGSGNILLQDPRPAVSYPYDNKAIAFEPKVGTTIFHPAYLWHESNTYVGTGIRAAVVVNYRVLTRNNSGIVKPLV
jgi:hypothetical protein